MVKRGFPGGASSKEVVVVVKRLKDAALIPGLGRSPEGAHSNPLQYSCLEIPHGQKSLEGYSCKELDTTE